ncbi:DEAD/DEAH box helicase family protein [Olleya sp. 1-3]|uniref:DEAD/DEAH box helicase family protein n=1 Tax=Olleya sp. 1-3 TaxID=2058323 RepID=UPI000C337CCF|nr:DEAD/DEAH box helicase family protein [Olleya sp. 1-3]PKG52929.1 DNA repair helicase [Olleya sp. 1-3]
MKKYFRELTFPSTYKYSSDSNAIPLEFYEEVFPISTNIDLLLGYFSSNAIKVLSRSFAEFIYNGGKMRLITNHVYSLADYENLLNDTNLLDEDKVINIFSNLSEIQKNLSYEGKHFFDCLKYLLKKGRLELIPVKFNNVDLAHCKKMILFDGRDHIVTEGSINFTLPALIKNSESFQVETPWNGDVSINRIEDEKVNFEKIINKTHTSYKHIEKESIEVVINSVGRDKDISDLLDDSLELNKENYGDKVKKVIERKKKRFDEKIELLSNTPKFPFPQGPREYQTEAFNAWKKNNYSGIFAMATGTGKTITSLNCLLNIYNNEQSYRAIILVPSIALLNQWEEEVKSFNFKKILKVGGGNNWEKELATYVSNYTWDIKDNLVIISTYGSFITDRFQKYFKKIEKDLILIADEAHNMGANNIRSKLNSIKTQKKIGLSATPKRIYDVEGTEAINTFFNDTYPYTYSFDMERALNEGFLTEYKYFPLVVELNENELEEYISISKKLLKFFDFEKGQFKNDPIVEILLLKRKNIIHKAKNKIECFKTILKQLNIENKLKYIFTYIPEGYIQTDEGDSEKILDKFITAGNETLPNLKMNSYTSEDSNLDDILRGFTEGKIDLLFAMKMLDEGVDVPRAEVGIFCSSTGNPRQFIQRRGRLLRKHPSKSFATIYDMIVIPKLSNNNLDYFNMEQNMVKNEIRRVAYFASLSMNFYNSTKNLENVLKKYDLNLDTIINEL